MVAYADVGIELKPEFLKAVYFILKEQAGVRRGERVLILSDSKTPQHVTVAFRGVAMQLGASAFDLKVPSAPHPAYQPGFQWDPLTIAAASEADVIIDMAVGYAVFLARLAAQGKRVIMPGDATGAPHIEDSLVRCLLLEDQYALRDEGRAIKQIMDAGSVLEIKSQAGTDYSVDISDLTANVFSGFMFDDARVQVSNYEITPGSMPGFWLPKGRGNGVMAMDGLLLYENVHEMPKSPILLEIVQGRIVNISGDPYLSVRLADWLERLDDDAAYNGPVHANIGLSRMARLTEHLEFERVRGAMTFGFGDSSILSDAYGYDPATTSKSGVHWDAQILSGSLRIDGKTISLDGIVQPCDATSE